MSPSAEVAGAHAGPADDPIPDGTAGGVPHAALVAAEAADAKLGQDAVVLAMGDLFGVVDAFVVTSGHNVRQIRSIVDEVERRLKEGEGRRPTAVEGLSDGTWVLMDYGDFVVHVFLEETRDFYDLEHLWSAAPRVDWRERVHAAG